MLKCSNPQDQVGSDFCYVSAVGTEEKIFSGVTGTADSLTMSWTEDIKRWIAVFLKPFRAVSSSRSPLVLPFLMSFEMAFGSRPKALPARHSLPSDHTDYPSNLCHCTPRTVSVTVPVQLTRTSCLQTQPGQIARSHNLIFLDVRDYVPVRLCLQKLAAGQIWPLSPGLPTAGLNERNGFHKLNVVFSFK